MGGSLLRHPVHSVECVVNDGLPVWALDGLLSPGRVITDRCRVAAYANRIRPVSLVVKCVDVVVIERIGYPGHIPCVIVGVAGCSFVGSVRRHGHRDLAPVVIINRMDFLQAGAGGNDPGDIGIRQFVIVNSIPRVGAVIEMGRVGAGIAGAAHGRGHAL